MDNKTGIPIAQGEGLSQAVPSALPASASVSGSTGLSCELSCELRTFITSIHIFKKKEDPSKQWTITKLGKRIKIPFKSKPGVLLWSMYWKQSWLRYGACSHPWEKPVWGRLIGTISLRHVLGICLLRNLCVWKILSWCGKRPDRDGCVYFSSRHGPRSTRSCWQAVWSGRQLGSWRIQRARGSPSSLASASPSCNPPMPSTCGAVWLSFRGSSIFINSPWKPLTDIFSVKLIITTLCNSRVKS